MLSCTPAPVSSAAASALSIASTPTPISATAPRARSAGSGSVVADREATTSWACGGRWSASSPMASRHCGFHNTPSSSSTSVTGSAIDDSVAATRRATIAATEPPGPARVCSTRRSLPPTCRRAAPRYWSRMAGSLSSSARVSHATLRSDPPTHCPITVDFPYPAGATTETTGASAAARRWASAADRSTVPARDAGGRSFASAKGAGAGARSATRPDDTPVPAMGVIVRRTTFTFNERSLR